MDTWEYSTPERLGTPSFSMDRAYEVPLYRTNAGIGIDRCSSRCLARSSFSNEKMEYLKTPSPELEKDLNS